MCCTRNAGLVIIQKHERNLNRFEIFTRVYKVSHFSSLFNIKGKPGKVK